MHLLALHDLERLANAFRPRSGIEERRRELALVHPLHAFVRNRVDAKELDVLLASSILGREICAIGHGVIVPIDQVDVLVGLEQVGHQVIGLVLLPVAVDLLVDELDTLLLVDNLVEAVGAVMRGLGSEAAPDFHDIALRLTRTAQHLYRIFTDRAPDHDIIATDELGELVGIHVPIEDDHRNAGFDRLQSHTL